MIRSIKSQIHVVILTETWIKNDLEALRLKLPNFTHYFNYRKHMRGGGVSVYVRNELKHEFLEEECEEGNHFLWIHLSKFSLDIGAIYKQPSANTDEFLEKYAGYLSKRKRVLVFGDFNLNLLSKERPVKEYKIMIQENGLRILNNVNQKYCTRETLNSKSILDHVCTSLKENHFKLIIMESNLSDHKQIYFEVNRFKPERPKRVKYTTIDYENLYKTIDESNTQENIYEKFEHSIHQAIAKNQIEKIKILNLPKSDWINKNITNSIIERNILWHNHKKSPEDEELRRKFLEKRNKVSREIQLTKNQYYHKEFKKCEKNPFKMWQLINNLSNNKMKDNGYPKKLLISECIISDDKAICESFNTFFATIGPKLANQIPKQYHSIQLAASSTSKHSTQKLAHIDPTNIEEVRKIIKSLKTNTSSGIDGVNAKLIKYIDSLVAENFTACINKCLQEGYFPNSLKMAKVSPIFKSGNRLDPGNYRPISVLPVFSKVFEKILHNRLSSHLTNIDFLSSKQYGFRPQSSTLSACIDLVTNIKVNIDKKKIALGIFIDLKKAFDTVSHQKLLTKLHDIGVTDVAQNIFASYLTNRYQIVKIAKIQSDPQPITYGVPQGSILGPLLFLVYIDSIQHIGLKGDITLYADDTCLFYFDQSVDKIIEQAQQDLNILNTWLKSNLLTINIAKTNYIVFAAKNKIIGDFNQLTINDEPIQRVNQEKYLGLILDQQLTWKPHIDKIRAKVTSLTGALRGIVKCLPYKVRLTIYNSLAKSQLQYLIEIWGSAAKSHLNKLQTAQNKLIRILFGYKRLTSTVKIYKETKLMNLSQLHKYNTCILIRKIITKDIRSNITFSKRSQIQKRITRQANHLILIKHRTNYGKKCITNEGAQHYNKIPDYIKDSKTITTFKNKLKYHIQKDFS